MGKMRERETLPLCEINRAVFVGCTPTGDTSENSRAFYAINLKRITIKKPKKPTL
jgi:glyceraldehyde-3-phosphate dehydrogenase/erythrose-4-phosphate dehydrogenase